MNIPTYQELIELQDHVRRSLYWYVVAKHLSDGVIDDFCLEALAKELYDYKSVLKYVRGKIYTLPRVSYIDIDSIDIDALCALHEIPGYTGMEMDMEYCIEHDKELQESEDYWASLKEKHKNRLQTIYRDNSLAERCKPVSPAEARRVAQWLERSKFSRS